MKHAWILVLAVLLACSDRSGVVVERPGEPAVVNFADDDAEMDAAIRRARESVQDFIGQLPALREKGDYFSVKVPIATESQTEHVWLESPEFSGGSFHGKLANVTLSGPLKLGDPVSTPAAEISDWMAVRDGALFGGFTVFVARSRMSPDQRREFEESLGFQLPDSPRSFP